MEEQDLDVQKPFYKKAWFWLVIIIVCNICMSLYNAVLVWIGVTDGGVKVELVNDKYESFSYLNNNEYKVSYYISDFESSYTKTKVNEDDYVYYDVTIKYVLSCQLGLNGRKYDDNTLTFEPSVVFFSTNNPEFETVVKTKTINSGHTYNVSYTIKNVCGGKDKELPSYNYYVGLSTTSN